MIITIDGPTASGKSTVARALANTLHFYYIATGYLYRAVAYMLHTQYGYTKETIAQPCTVHVQACVANNRLRYRYTPEQGAHVIVDGTPITPLLKTPLIDLLSSLISTDPGIRTHMVALQRTLANAHDVVVEGRDCGSVVFPQADIKFFLTASLTVRAQRWQADQAKKGTWVTLEQAEHFIADRDRRDEQRHISPLVLPAGAHVIDNSTLTQEETVAVLLAYIKKDNPTIPY